MTSLACMPCVITSQVDLNSRFDFREVELGLRSRAASHRTTSHRITLQRIASLVRPARPALPRAAVLIRRSTCSSACLPACLARQCWHTADGPPADATVDDGTRVRPKVITHLPTLHVVYLLYTLTCIPSHRPRPRLGLSAQHGLHSRVEARWKPHPARMHAGAQKLCGDTDAAGALSARRDTGCAWRTRGRGLRRRAARAVWVERVVRKARVRAWRTLFFLLVVRVMGGCRMGWR